MKLCRSTLKILLFLTVFFYDIAAFSMEGEARLEDVLEHYKEVIDGYSKLDEFKLADLNPFYNGSLFVLGTYNTVGVAKDVQVFTKTQVTVVPGTPDIPGYYTEWSDWGSVERIKNIRVRSGLSWIFARASYLNNNGISVAGKSNLTQAFEDFSSCVKAGNACWDLKLETDYIGANQLGKNTDQNEYRDSKYASKIEYSCHKEKCSACKFKVYEDKLIEKRSRKYIPAQEGTPDKKLVQEKQEYRSVEKDKKWNFDIAPIVYLDTQGTSYIVDQNTSNKYSYLKAGDFEKASSIPRLYPSDKSDLYRIVKYGKNILGVGVAVRANYENAGWLSALTPFLGALPIFGQKTITERTLKGTQENLFSNHLDIPETVDDFSTWNKDDKLTYMRQGGLMFYLGISAYMFYTSLNYTAAGTWAYTFHKLSDRYIYLNIQAQDLTSFAVVGGVTLQALSVSDFDNAEDQFSYIFDIKSKNGRDTLNTVLSQNDLKAAQEVIANSLGGVSSVNTINIQTLGGVTPIALGLPFVSYSKGSGKLYAARNTIYHPDNSETNTEYGIYLETSDKRFFNYSQNRTMGFYGADYITNRQEAEYKHGYFGQFVYSFKETSNSRQELIDEIESIITLTGMRRELMVEVPENIAPGSVNLELVVKINKYATDYLMDMTSSKEKLAVFEYISDSFYKTYFKKIWIQGEDDLGKKKIRIMGDKNDVCKSNNLDLCKYFLAKDTKAAIKNMKVALQDMHKAQKAGQRTEFTEAYARFGEAMVENQFTFQTIVNLLKGRGISAFYSIKGTGIKKYELIFHWVPEVAIAESKPLALEL